MSEAVVGVVRAKRALCMVCAVLLALSVAVFSAQKAEAEPVVASYYGAGFAGQPTASGEPFDPNALTAAHPTLPFGTQLEVCYESCAVVTVNDRGPFVGDRGLDLSRGAADAIGLTPVGVDTVDVEVLGQGGGTQPVASEPAPQQAADPAQEPAATEPVASTPAASTPAASAPQAAPQSAEGQDSDGGAPPAAVVQEPDAAVQEPAATEGEFDEAQSAAQSVTQSSTQTASGSNINQSSQQSQNVVGDISVSGGQNVTVTQGGF